MFLTEVPHESPGRVKAVIIAFCLIPLCALALVDFFGFQSTRHLIVLIHPSMLTDARKIAVVLQELRLRQPAVAALHLVVGQLRFLPDNRIFIDTPQQLPDGPLAFVTEEDLTGTSRCFSADAGPFSVSVMLLHRRCIVHEINHVRAVHTSSTVLEALTWVYSRELVNALGDVYIDGKQLIRDLITPAPREDVVLVDGIADGIRLLAAGHPSVTIPEPPDSPYRRKSKGKFRHPLLPNIHARRRLSSLAVR